MIMRDSSAAICHRYEGEGWGWGGLAERGKERERETWREGGGREVQTFCSATLPQTHHYAGLWPSV